MPGAKTTLATGHGSVQVSWYLDGPNGTMGWLAPYSNLRENLPDPQGGDHTMGEVITCHPFRGGQNLPWEASDGSGSGRSPY